MIILDCPDQPGIVHAVSGFLFERGGNIVESQQFFDRLNGRFFMRIDFTLPGSDTTEESLRADFAGIARAFEMTFEIWGARAPYRTLVMVSKQLHCLNDLLFRASNGSLQIDIPVVVSNHPDAEALVRSHGIEFRHIPVTPDTKADAEAELMDLHKELGIHLVVLARYMQVLSDDVCRQLSGQAINIHHSFLPSFKGARPYHQAFERGVKLIGATAHYVTADLDEGPIIEQDVIRVDHNHTQDQLARAGRDVEAQVLSRAVRWHSESRVLLERAPDGRLPLTDLTPRAVGVRAGAALEVGVGVLLVLDQHHPVPELSRSTASTPYGRSSGSWMNSTPFVFSSSACLAAVVGGEAEAVHAALVERAVDRLDHLGRERRTGHGEVHLELGLAGVAHRAPPVVAERDVLALVEAEDLDVELLRRVDVLDEDAGQGDVRDHATTLAVPAVGRLLLACGLAARTLGQPRHQHVAARDPRRVRSPALLELARASPRRSP